MNQYQQDHGNAPEQVKGRFLVFVIILILMFAYLFVGLVNLQLKSSEGYSTKTESTRLKTIPLTGKRGNITDANSVILATDEMVYNVTFYKDASESSSSVYKTYTQSIIDTLKIIERNGGKLAFSYVIQRSEETGEWEFNFGSGVSDATLQTRESQWRSNNYVTAKSYPTPEDCLVTLKHRYRMVNSAEEEEEVRAAYIEKRGDDAAYTEDGEHFIPLSGSLPVSMNFWGFTPWIFTKLEEYFNAFLHAIPAGELKKECLLPSMVGELIEKGQLRVSVLHSDAKWFGMTYHEDKDAVAAALKALHDAGVYPPTLHR